MLVTFHRDLFHCFLIWANYIKVLFWAKITSSSIQLPNYYSEIKIDWSCVFLTCKFYSAWFVWAAGKADGHWINRCKDCLHCGLIIDPLIITKRQPVLFLRKYDKGRTEKLASSQFHYRLQKNLLWIEAEKQFTRSPVETGCSSSSKVYLLYIWLFPLRGLEITHSQKPHYPKIDQQVQCRQGRCLYWFWSSLSWLNSSTSERVKDKRRDIWTRNLVYI